MAAMLSSEFRFDWGADGADDGAAEMVEPLAGNQTDSAGRGVKKDGHAGFDLKGLTDQILDR